MTRKREMMQRRGLILQPPPMVLTQIGQDKVHTAEGTGMNISHIGDSILRTPHGSFDLKNILLVPDTTKNLLSIHWFTLDNHVFIEFHPFF
jgi:hypothetical protein